MAMKFGSSHRPNVTTEKLEILPELLHFKHLKMKMSSNVNEKEKCKKRKKIPENDSEIFLKGMVEVIKNFTDSQDKRMGALIDKIGNRDQSIFVIKFIPSSIPYI
ncbi:hypothetical protein H5410_011065 [Solanum commersonii]|uniref:Uncharacterized protein n=1 Tax=Solanum commersonii TaxID=4109 RepID=A0A9J6AP54_SOLCO|nr:hypothetical protein H5410_011065 [Solanum commersonii]